MNFVIRLLQRLLLKHARGKYWYGLLILCMGNWDWPWKILSHVGFSIYFYSIDSLAIRHITAKYSETDVTGLDSFNDEKSFLKILSSTGNEYRVFYMFNTQFPHLLIPQEKSSNREVDNDAEDSGYNDHTYFLPEGRNRPH